jgi:hypothetical protein
MNAIETLFTTIFLVLYSLLFPLFKKPVLVTYVVIFLLICWMAYKGYHQVRSRSLRDKGIKAKGVFLIYVLGEIMLILMIIWYVFVHFPTYKIM